MAQAQKEALGACRRLRPIPAGRAADLIRPEPLSAEVSECHVLFPEY